MEKQTKNKRGSPDTVIDMDTYSALNSQVTMDETNKKLVLTGARIHL